MCCAQPHPLLPPAPPAGVDNLYDGISADPMEVMFIKVKQFLLRDGASAATASVKYEHWQGDAEQGRSKAARNISSEWRAAGLWGAASVTA